MALTINNPRYGNIFVAADTLAELRSVSSKQIKEGYSAIVAGDLKPGDGFGGMLVWNATSTVPDDSRAVIAPQDGQAGRWVKIAVGEAGPRGETVVGPQGAQGVTGPQGAGLVDVMAPAGASLVGYQRSAAADVVNLYDRLKREVWAEDYGFKVTNTGTQNTAAFNRAVADLPLTGGVIRVGPGTFVVNQLLLPVDPKVVDIQGSGVRATILEMGTPDGPLIRRNGLVFGDGRITGARIGGFTIRAHAASDRTNLSHRAVSFTGFCKALFHDVSYKGNPNALGSVGAVFEGDAATGSTYSNVFERIECAGNNGAPDGLGGKNGVAPSRLLYTHNGGIGSAGNPNLTELRDSWIYANSGLNLACDVYNSTRTRIDNVIFEDCPGASAIGLGQSTMVVACWFELFATNILTSPLASVDGSGSVVMGNYFSGAGTNSLGAIGRKILWIGNEGGGQSFTGVGYTVVRGATAEPAAPTLTRTAGAAATSGPALRGAVVAIPKDALGRTTFSLGYNVVPAEASFMELTVSAPSGYVIEQMTMGVTRDANGRPVITALQPDNIRFFALFESTDNYQIVVRVTLREV